MSPLDASRAHLANLVHAAEARHLEGILLTRTQIRELAQACAEVAGQEGWQLVLADLVGPPPRRKPRGLSCHHQPGSSATKEAS